MGAARANACRMTNEARPPHDVGARRLRASAAFGAVVLVMLLPVPLPSTAGMAAIERLLLAGPLLAVPLGLAAVVGARQATLHTAAVQPVFAAFALVSVVLGAGPAAIASAAVYAAWAAALAVEVAVSRLRAARRVAGSGLPALMRGLLSTPLDELLIDLGALYLPVGAGWLVLSRRGGPFLEFDEAIVALTAVHFHFAGFAAATVAGLVGRGLRGRRAHRVWAAPALVVGLGPPLVALGITFSPVVEVVSAVVLAAGVVGLAGVMLACSVPEAWRHSRVQAGALATSALSLFGTMALAVLYAKNEWAGTPNLAIPTMVLTHGVGNALGFATCGLWALGDERLNAASPLR